MSNQRFLVFKNILKSLELTFLFILVYAVYLKLNSDILSDSGYDAHRFYNIAISNAELISDFNIIEVLRFTIFNGFLLYCPFLFFCIIYSAGFYGIKLPSMLLFFFTTPIMIFCFEAGKDILIISSSISAYTACFSINKKSNISRVGQCSLFLMSAILFFVLYYVKGLTSMIYLFLIILMIASKRYVKYAWLVVIPAFLFGVYTRGFAEYDVVAAQTSFNSALLISTGFSYSLIYESIFRFLIILSAPLWYWFYMLIHIYQSPGEVFIFIGYMSMAIYFFKNKLYSNRICVIAALLFAVSYPFIHLRYYFSFVVSFIVIQIFTAGQRPQGSLLANKSNFKAVHNFKGINK